MRTQRNRIETLYKRYKFWAARKAAVKVEYEVVFKKIQQALDEGRNTKGIILTSLYKRERELETLSKTATDRIRMYAELRPGKIKGYMDFLKDSWHAK